MYQALYRSFRPETFSQIIGQTHIVRILQNQIRSGQVGHAYLFCGTRGTGKTTTARILAKAVNCLAEEGDRPCGQCQHCLAIQKGIFMDVIEIDAASNNGVDNVRELKDSLQYPPAQGRKKVYIIDEVHMLSINASNALLKSLEEPPENVIFILATTEPQKLPATILSRCIRLDFKRISEKLLIENMASICMERGVTPEPEALSLIAANADGSARDSLSLLDQCLASGDRTLTRDGVLELLGTVGEEVLIRLTDLIQTGETRETLVLLDQIITDGKEVRQLMKDLLSHFRNLLIAKYVENPMDLIHLSAENVQRIVEQSQRSGLEFINSGILELARMQSEARWSTQPRVLLELCLIQLSAPIQAGGQAAAQIPVRQAAPAEPKKAAPVPEVVKSASEPAVNPAPQSSKELDSLWMKVLHEGADRKGSFAMLARGTKISEMNQQQFCIACENEIAARQVESEKQMIEELMTKHCGRPLRVTYTMGDAQAAAEQSSVEELAEQISGQFGLEITIE